MPSTSAYPQAVSTYSAPGFDAIGWDDTIEVIGVFDNGYATTQDLVTDNTYSTFLVGYNFDFSSIPSNATITGLSLLYYLHADSTGAIPSFSLNYDGDFIGNLYSNNDIGNEGVNGMNVTGVTPGVGFRFGLSPSVLTASLVLAPEFGLGIAFAGTSSPGNYAYLDAMSLQVYWEYPQGGTRSRARALGRGR